MNQKKDKNQFILINGVRYKLDTSNDLLTLNQSIEKLISSKNKLNTNIDLNISKLSSKNIIPNNSIDWKTLNINKNKSDFKKKVTETNLENKNKDELPILDITDDQQEYVYFNNALLNTNDAILHPIQSQKQRIKNKPDNTIKLEEDIILPKDSVEEIEMKSIEKEKGILAFINNKIFKKYNKS